MKNILLLGSLVIAGLSSGCAPEDETENDVGELQQQLVLARFEAETMTAGIVVSDGAASRGQAIQFATDRTPASKSVAIPRGTTHLLLHARRNTPSGNGDPELLIVVPGVYAGKVRITTSGYADYPVVLPATSGTRTIEISLDNPAPGGSSVRMALLDWVALADGDPPPPPPGS